MQTFAKWTHQCTKIKRRRTFNALARLAQETIVGQQKQHHTQASRGNCTLSWAEPIQCHQVVMPRLVWSHCMGQAVCSWNISILTNKLVELYWWWKGWLGLCATTHNNTPFTCIPLSKLTTHFEHMFQPCFQASCFPLLESIHMSKAMDVQAIIPFTCSPLPLVRCQQTCSQTALGNNQAAN